VVIATGGTIASASAGKGRGAVAQHGAGRLTEGKDFGDVEVEAHDLFSLGSYLFGHRELRLIAEAVADHTARGDVDGVVVTHGTDTMEETAYLLDLVHHSDKPVVLTGAQRAADEPDTDGPRNLMDAVSVAASTQTRGCGALIVFAGQVFAARGTRKQHTIGLDAFHTVDGGPIGGVAAGDVRMRARPVRPWTLPLPDASFDGTRVDVVSLYPGADATLARAAVDAGAQAVVLAGTGSGNGNHALLDWAREAVSAGVVVGLSTRVPEGPVVPMYGNGGGVDFVNVGAVVLDHLPLLQARLLLVLLLASGEPVDQETVTRFTGG
jgi:L-asparaginase